MAVERLEIQLEAKADKFKQEINEAKIKLNELQLAAIKAGGGSQKLAKKIKVQRNEVKRLRLSYETATLELKRHASQQIKTAGATNKLTNGQKRSRQAFTQIAYAMDDMQYGFQGVQNNIQAMAVSLGASGPLIIGITAVVAAIGFFVKKMEKAQKAAKETQKALSEKQGLVAEMLIYADVVKDTTAGTKEHEDALKRLRDNGFDGTIEKIDEYIVALKKQMLVEAQLAGQKAILQRDLAEQNKLIKERDDILAIGGNVTFDDKGMVKDSGFLSAYNRRKVDSLKEEIDELGVTIEKTIDKSGDLAKSILGTDVKGKSTYTKTVQELKDEIAEVDQMVEDLLIKGQPLLDQEVIDVGDKLFNKGGQFEDVGEQDAPFIDLESIDLDDDTQRYLENLRLMIDETNTLRDSVGGAFADLGGIIATNLGRNGDALSSFLGAAIGTYTKLLAANATFLAKLIPMKATEAGVNATASATETASKIPFGAFVLPALIAGGLAAVSSAFSSVGASAKGGGGGGGGGSRSASSTAARPNPIRENSKVRGNNILIPFDDIRLGNEAGSNNYSSSS